MVWDCCWDITKVCWKLVGILSHFYPAFYPRSSGRHTWVFLLPFCSHSKPVMWIRLRESDWFKITFAGIEGSRQYVPKALIQVPKKSVLLYENISNYFDSNLSKIHNLRLQNALTIYLIWNRMKDIYIWLPNLQKPKNRRVLPSKTKTSKARRWHKTK